MTNSYADKTFAELEEKLAVALSVNNKSRRYSKYSTYNEEDKEQIAIDELLNDYDQAAVVQEQLKKLNKEEEDATIEKSASGPNL